MNRNFKQNTSCKFCPICRDAGRDAHDHALRIDGVLNCPYLRAIVCSECGCTGDEAHTLSHCPVYKQRMVTEKAQREKDEKEAFKERQQKRNQMDAIASVPDSAKVFPQQPFSTLTMGNVRTFALRCELGLTDATGLLQNFYDNYQNRLVEMTATWNSVVAIQVKKEMRPVTPPPEKKKMVILCTKKRNDDFAAEKKIMWADSDDEMDYDQELKWESEIPEGVSDTVVA